MFRRWKDWISGKSIFVQPLKFFILVLTWPLAVYLASIMWLTVAGLAFSLTTGCMPVVRYRDVPPGIRYLPFYGALYAPVYAFIDSRVINQEVEWEALFGDACMDRLGKKR